MDFDTIKNILRSQNLEIESNVISRLSELKKDAVKSDNQVLAKDIWCHEQIIDIKNNFLAAYNCILERSFFAAWTLYERVEITLQVLRRHFNYDNDEYNLRFIEDYTKKFQSLFPYKIFGSRETVILSTSCSICGKEFKLRDRCQHKIGEIYNGEMCRKKVEDFEWLGIAIVENPDDKYCILKPRDMEYNYSLIEKLTDNLTGPYDIWQIVLQQRIKPMYRNIGRNSRCPCGSGKKYKRCCYLNGNDRGDHYKFILPDNGKAEIVPFHYI